MRILRYGLLALLGLDLFAVVLLTAVDRVLLSYPGGRGFVLRVLVGLLAYGAIVLWATGVRRRSRIIAVGTGAALGVAGGIVETLLQIQQRFLPIGGPVGDYGSLAAMVFVFGLWSVAGYRAIRLAGRRLSAAIAGPWSGCVTTIISVTCGLCLALFAAPSAGQVVRWAVFQSSGWANASAFASANALDNAFTHLCAGPIIGLIFGTAGGAAGRYVQRLHAREDDV